MSSSGSGSFSLTSVPQGGGDVGAAGGGALLALVLEGAADETVDQRVDVGRLVGEDEILAAGLAHDARVGAVLVGCSRRRSYHMPLRRPRY